MIGRCGNQDIDVIGRSHVVLKTLEVAAREKSPVRGGEKINAFRRSHGANKVIVLPVQVRGQEHLDVCLACQNAGTQKFPD